MTVDLQPDVAKARIPAPRAIAMQWQECANSGHTPTSRRMGQIDPELPFEIGPMNGREARESGL
jgi:hypothetical protein